MPIEKFHLRREGEGGWDCLEREKKRKEVAGRRSKLRNLLSKDEISGGAARLNFNPAKKLQIYTIQADLPHLRISLSQF